MRKAFGLLFVFPFFYACSGAAPTPLPDTGDDDGGSGDDAAPGGDDAGADAAADAQDVAPAGTVKLDACKGLSGSTEACTIVADATACTSAKCTKLVIVFAGGEEGCAATGGYAEVMKKFGADGYAAACIDTFETATGSDSAPYVDEAPRLDATVKAVTTGAWAQRYWTGEGLLFAGISHGATAPPIVMARTTLDDQAPWRGTKKTAACFFDGSFDQAATSQFLTTNNCTAPVSYQRWNSRYCGAGASSCDLTMNAKAQQDTITAVAADAYAIKNWKLVECGSA
ncbi:MAG TPA: hypothetical protein VIF62_05300, partial [Labilithrix sp.]